MVTFNYLAPDKTRVLLSIDYESQGMLENAGSALGFMDRRVKGDLERFKTFQDVYREPGAGDRRLARDDPGPSGAWRAVVRMDVTAHGW